MRKGKGRLTHRQAIMCYQQEHRRYINVRNERDTYKKELQKLQKELKARA